PRHLAGRAPARIHAQSDPYGARLMEPVEQPLHRVRPRTEGQSRALTEEADRFAAERVCVQLATEPVDEPAAEELLHEAYAATGLSAPGHVHWLEGPLELVAVLARGCPRAGVGDEFRDRVPNCVWDDVQLDADEIAYTRDGAAGDVTASVDYRIRTLLREAHESARARMVLRSGRRAAADIGDLVRRRVVHPIWGAVRDRVGGRNGRAVGAAARCTISSWINGGSFDIAEYSTWHGIRAYEEAVTLAHARFYDEYFERNHVHALARFNELLSGYWLGRAVALLVRRPRLLALDEEGRPHSATGRCVEYHDGWGFWAWHGVEGAAKVILSPAELTRDDFLSERNVEVRRVIQERMGARFVPEIGGTFLDSSAHGVLYQIDMPGDPDRVARYLQVQDPSTGREYYLRVPPDVATAAEALAWTFGLSPEEYRPAGES